MVLEAEDLQPWNSREEAVTALCAELKRIGMVMGLDLQGARHAARRNLRWLTRALSRR